jgi:hypothetical protein
VRSGCSREQKGREDHEASMTEFEKCGEICAGLPQLSPLRCSLMQASFLAALNLSYSTCFPCKNRWTIAKRYYHTFKPLVSLFCLEVMFVRLLRVT